MLAALSACQEEPQPAAVEASPVTPPPPEPAPAPAPPPAQAVKVSEDSDLYQFDYAYPAEAAAIPGLRALLDSGLAEARSKIATEAREGHAAAKRDGFPFNPFFSSHDWKVVTELPGWISLSSLVSEYTGGAHPNSWFDAILWDKSAERRIMAVDMFVSKQALSAAIRPQFCRQIDAQRRTRRGEGPPPGGEDMFWDCLDPVDYVLIPGSSDRQHFDRIGILVPPYEAGPYAEGPYEATVAVTPAVMKALKPQYRSAFAPGR